MKKSKKKEHYHCFFVPDRYMYRYIIHSVMEYPGQSMDFRVLVLDTLSSRPRRSKVHEYFQFSFNQF